MAVMIVAQLFASLDGVVENPERWHFPFVDSQVTDAVLQFYTEIDALLLGRRTYDIFAATWPTRPSSELGDRINNVRKLVVTSSSMPLDWSGSEPLAGDPGVAVPALVQHREMRIGVVGSIRVIDSLVQRGALDELRLLIHPTIVGDGRRLTALGARFDLAALTATPSGVIDARYRPPRHTPTAAPKERI